LTTEAVRSTLGFKKEEIIGGWGKLRNGDLHDLYSSPDVIRVIKPRTTWWARNVARTREKKSCNILA
jgi:hypothetical protein